MIDEAVEEVEPLVGTAPACRALGASRASLYRRRTPPEPRPRRPRPAPARALSGAEREAVLEQLHSERFVDSSPAQVWATLLDEGRYLASERTMYRVLAANGEVRERRDQLSHPPYERPELLAERPNQVWSWDVERHEALLNRAVMKGHRGRPVAAGWHKLGAAFPVGTDGHGWQAAPTTTGRASTARWSGSGKRDGKVYERNQCLNASQEQTTSSNLADLGWAATRIRASVRRTPWPVNVVGREATVKVCGVAVAMLQGHSWSPHPTSGSE